MNRLTSELVSGSYYLQLDLHLAYMLRVVRPVRTDELEQALVQLYASPDVSAFVKRDIVLVLAYWDALYWLSNQKHFFSQQHPWVQRSLIAASYRLGDEGRYWRQQVAPRLGRFDTIVMEWMKDRVVAPTWEVPI